MPADRFEGMDLDGEDPETILKKLKSSLTIRQVAEWMWENQIQQVCINPETRPGGLLNLKPKLVRFPKK
jgi:hypothetical protein